MIIETKQLGVYGANCYIITNKKTKHSIVIDPGGESEDIVKYLEKNKYMPRYVMLTHGHGDHIAGIPGLREKYKLDVFVHEKDKDLLEDSEKNLSSKMPVKSEIQIDDYKLFKEGNKILLDSIAVEIIHTPGHTRGSSVLQIGDKLFTGDTLFKGSVGRTDLYGGGKDIVNSINNKLMVLNDQFEVYPGHGEKTTIGEERAKNPFLKK